MKNLSRDSAPPTYYDPSVSRMVSLSDTVRRLDLRLDGITDREFWAGWRDTGLNRATVVCLLLVVLCGMCPLGSSCWEDTMVLNFGGLPLTYPLNFDKL
jgi:hypothetical protein